jgi:NADH:ubiquinone oxidoreductase subunit D
MKGSQEHVCMRIYTPWCLCSPRHAFRSLMTYIPLLQFPRRLNEIESYLLKIVFGGTSYWYRVSSRENALKWASGCMLRGSVLLGTYAYSNVWFIMSLIAIPIGSRGDCYDRLTTYTEMRESLKIISMP